MTGVYEVQINGDPGCTAFLSTTIYINPPCVVSVAPTAKAVCVGNTIEILANGKDAIAHAWRGPGNFVSSLTDPFRLNATTAFAGVYTVVATGSAGATCTSSATLSISVGNLPTATASSNTPLTLGQSLNLSATGGGTYVWAGPNGFSSTSQTPTRLNINASSTGIYTVSVSSTAGCVATATTSVTVNAACNVSINPAANKICAGGKMYQVTFGKAQIVLVQRFKTRNEIPLQRPWRVYIR
jgi:hypothetical protein